MSSNAHQRGLETGLFKQKLGVGTWAWGDKLFWEFGKEYDHFDAEEVFKESLQAGISFFDTAEVYGMGLSEKILGEFIRTAQTRVLVASKFMPFPWRLSGSSLHRALSHSLKRLGLPSLDLYQIHSPLPPISIKTWMDAMAEAYQEGLIKAVGVSNFSLNQTEIAAEALARHGIRLASNQVEYHLLDRRIEKDGLFEFCTHNHIQIIAYSPLAQGLLTGKYTAENPPSGVRGMRYRNILDQITPLIALMRKLGESHDGKSPSSVALNWLICKGAFPIPGAKNRNQLTDNLSATSWRLTESDISQLDETSAALELGL